MVEQTALLPLSIDVIEKYMCETKISGPRTLEFKKPEGLIEVLVRYDQRRAISTQSEPSISNNLSTPFYHYTVGHLCIKEYGVSNLNQHPALDWDDDTLPIIFEIDPNDSEIAHIQQRSYFDLLLTDTYDPDNLIGEFLIVNVELVDEDSITPHIASESQGKMLLDNINKQDSLKHSLTLKFKVQLRLPKKLGSKYFHRPLKISRMTLSWPLTTPHRLAKIHSGNRKIPFSYDPENKFIQWGDIILKHSQNVPSSEIINFVSDWIKVEIGDPIDFYQKLDLSGDVDVEVSGLLSGANLQFTASAINGRHVVPTFHTRFVNEFVINLRESIESKQFSPRQHLYFPGVILNEMRIVDILMLLEDKGFEVKKSLDLPVKGGPVKKRHEIEAQRNEGAKILTIKLYLEGLDSSTTRERNVLGNAKYTTPLSRGDMSVDITGQMNGDSKRVVNIVNEIQKRLKEQFKHVGNAE